MYLFLISNEFVIAFGMKIKAICWIYLECYHLNLSQWGWNPQIAPCKTHNLLYNWRYLRYKDVDFDWDDKLLVAMTRITVNSMRFLG